ncbi:hypothetical protein C1893_04260 [Pseudomonas sp. MPR-ANC1]|nr:hypothetical protein C1893_04260 [Pseudomonas sp. MPR-ANC1]
MALFLLGVVAGEWLIEVREFSEESYFYFFRELSCLAPHKETRVRGDAVRLDRAALAQGL